MGASDSEVLARSKARIGKVLRERWTLDELLGLGGMAAVYAATHRNGKRVAIKVLQPEAAAVPDVRARFLREGYLANRVGHDGAVSILDDDIDEDGTVFLVMELLEGESLDTRWHHHSRLPWREVLLIADQVLSVLQSAHAKGIVHRDLKPGNIFIEKTGGVKVLDFGIARLEVMDLRPGDTGYGTALGTPGFMPPEQARGRWDQIDSRSDLFALGATMYAVLSNRHIHEADTANEQFMLAMTAQAAPLAQIVSDLPEEVTSIVDRALRYEKEGRWDHASAMREAVQRAYEQLTGEPLSPSQALSPPVLGASSSLTSNAPTLGVEDLEPASRSRMSTTRPVTDSPSARARRGKRRWLFVTAGAAVLAGIAFWLTRPEHPSTSSVAASTLPASSLLEPEPSTTESAPAATTAESATPAPSIDAPDAASPDVPEAPPPKSASGPSMPTQRRHPPKSKPPVAKPPAPAAESSATAEPVDIFSRRK